MPVGTCGIGMENNYLNNSNLNKSDVIFLRKSDVAVSGQAHFAKEHGDPFKAIRLK